MLKVLTRLAFTFVLFFSVTANAGLVLINGYQFIDNGRSTIDVKTGIEWLDVNLTTDRTYNDVLYDITHEGGTFAKSEGWRFARKEELFQLFSSVFKINFSNTIRFSEREHEVNVFLFINLFGDNFVSYSDVRGFTQFDPRSNSAAGYTSGFVLQSDDASVLETAIIADSEFYVLDREVSPSAYFYDDNDYIHYGRLVSKVGVNYHDLIRYPSLGAWLIRDAEIAAVHEPKTIFLFITIASILVLRRNFFG